MYIYVKGVESGFTTTNVYFRQLAQTRKFQVEQIFYVNERAAKKIQESLGDYNRGEFTISSLEDFVKETKKETKTGYHYNLFFIQKCIKKTKIKLTPIKKRPVARSLAGGGTCFPPHIFYIIRNSDMIL